MTSTSPQAPGVYSRQLGEVAWNCIWADRPSNDPDQLVPCEGLLTVASSSKVALKMPLSTAAVSFWIPESALLPGLGPALLDADLVAPTVLRSTGSWAKVCVKFGQISLNCHVILTHNHTQTIKCSRTAGVASAGRPTRTSPTSF